MSKLTYIHNNDYYSRKFKKRNTIALELPTSEELIKCSKYFIEIGSVHFPLVYGLTNVSNKDQFNRKIGREEAEKKISLKMVEILSIFVDDKAVVIGAKLTEEHVIYFKVYHDSKRVRVHKPMDY